jgi:hypothetical protein
MWFRVLPLLCLFLLSQASRSQQKVIDVPFDSTLVAGSPIQATGTLSVLETVVGNQVQSLWDENVVAKNISNKPILLLIGVLEAVGPHSDGGYTLIADRFFSQDVIQPGDTIPYLRTGPVGRSSCCINPLEEPRDPRAAFRVEFVQFVDGSTFGAPARARDVLVSRTSTLLVLRNLDQTYSEQGEQKFNAQLEESARNEPGLLWWIQKTQKKRGTGAAISEVRKMLAFGKEREAMIRKQSAK